jgi:hypothetical protein
MQSSRPPNDRVAEFVYRWRPGFGQERNTMSFKIIRLVTAGAFALSLAACASAYATSETAASGSPGTTSTTIVAADLQATRANNLYDAIQQMRPEWFRRVGATPIRNTQDHPIAVYIDNQRAGTVEILRQTGILHAAAVKYFSPSEAQMRFGEGNMNGVIQVVTASGKSP